MPAALLAALAAGCAQGGDPNAQPDARSTGHDAAMTAPDTGVVEGPDAAQDAPSTRPDVPPDVPVDTAPPGECTPGETRACYTGTAATRGVGICADGTQTCGTTARWGTACAGQVLPRAMEVCGNGQDDDCDGTADNACGACNPGESRACYSGATGTEGRGVCHGGTQTCSTTRAWGTCLGEVAPAAETCGNSLDDDCDGTVDNGCGVCTPGTTRACYTGASGTSGRGACHDGMQTCTSARDWPTACAGEVVPAAEVCGNSVDEDCDGSLTNGCPTGPANDNRASATALTLGTTETTVAGTTTGATHDGPTVTCGCTSGGNVWYRFVLTAREVVYFDTAGSSVDTSLFVTDSAGNAVPSQGDATLSNPGLCNDDAGCSAGGFTSTLQSWTFGVFDPGTYYVAVGGCSAGAFNLHAQHFPVSVGSYFYSARLTGSSTTSTVLVGTSAASGTCGGTASGEDVRWFVTCGASQTFSLCTSDGGTFSRAIGTTSYDPAMYIRSGTTGAETACNDDGGTGCAGTGGDTLTYGSRLSGTTVPRGLNLLFVDERTGGTGMTYTLRYTVN